MSDPASGAGWRGRLRAFWPAPVAVDARERLRVVVGAALGILSAGLVGVALTATHAGVLPWLVAPLGASAVLVFGVPASPLAQPWAVVGGNTLSALVAILCCRVIDTPVLAAAVAVGGAIAVMFLGRCLHPPGGASALLMALTGVDDPWFALLPVGINSLALVVAGLLYNNLTGRAYPHAQFLAVHAPALAAVAGDGSARSGPALPAAPQDADLEAVLAQYNQILPIPPDDLLALLEDARLQGYRRRLADVRCVDVMSRAPITVTPEASLAAAWTVLATHRIKALPVVDAGQQLVGIVTQADFIRAAMPAAGLAHAGAGADAQVQPGRDGVIAQSRTVDATGRALAAHLDARHALAANAGVLQLQAVGSIMTREVRVTHVDRHLSDLVPLFGDTGHHHLPVLDGRGALVGIVTQSDVIAALHRIGGDAL